MDSDGPALPDDAPSVVMDARRDDVLPDVGASMDVRDAPDATADASADDGRSGDRPDVSVPPVDTAPPVDVPVDVPTDVPGAQVGAPGTPTVDGVLGADWPAGSLAATNAEPSPWGPTLNALRSLRVAWDAQRLYLGIEGTVEARNAIAVYLDRDFVPGDAATGLTRIDTLTDATGALDDALSAAIVALPGSFGAELAWGTLGMQRKAATELRADIGLRDLACPRCAGDLAWVMGDQVECVGGASPGCEVALPWSSIYGPAGRPPSPRLGLFVRLVSASGASVAPGQCLPPQDGPAAEARSVAVIAPSL